MRAVGSCNGPPNRRRFRGDQGVQRFTLCLFQFLIQQIGKRVRHGGFADDEMADRHTEGGLDLVDEAAEILDFYHERIHARALLHPDREERVIIVAAGEADNLPIEDAHGQRVDAIARDAHDADATLWQIVKKQLEHKRGHEDAADRLGSGERRGGGGQTLGQGWPGAYGERETGPKQGNKT